MHCISSIHIVGYYYNFYTTLYIYVLFFIEDKRDSSKKKTPQLLVYTEINVS